MSIKIKGKRDKDGDFWAQKSDGRWVMLESRLLTEGDNHGVAVPHDAHGPYSDAEIELLLSDYSDGLGPEWEEMSQEDPSVRMFRRVETEQEKLARLEKLESAVRDLATDWSSQNGSRTQAFGNMLIGLLEEAKQW